MKIIQLSFSDTYIATTPVVCRIYYFLPRPSVNSRMLANKKNHTIRRSKTLKIRLVRN